jgi:cytochrome c oxidase cbb3-type subunit I/II
MPGYKWLFDNEPLDISNIETKMQAMKTLGVPYSDAEIKDARNNMAAQSLKIENNLKTDPDFVKSYENSEKTAVAKHQEFVPMRKREIVALISYIQRLGTDIKVKDNLKK